MTTQNSCEGCKHFQDDKCYSQPGVVYPAVYGHTCCIHGNPADFMDKTTSGSCVVMNHNETHFQIPSYDSYYAFRKAGGTLHLDMSGARLILESGRDPHDVYRDLQAVFCEIMSHEMRFFMEN